MMKKIEAIVKPFKMDEVKEKVEEVFNKVENEVEEKKKPRDNQLLRAIDLLKGIKIYRKFETG